MCAHSGLEHTLLEEIYIDRNTGKIIKIIYHDCEPVEKIAKEVTNIDS